MKILFELTHPKHYYQFRTVIKKLKEDGHQLMILARDKDVLLAILQEEKLEYAIYGQHGKSLLEKLTVLPRLLVTYYKLVKKFRPDLIVSKASPYAAIISRLNGVKTVITPDSEVVTLTNKFVAPKSTLVITPVNYALDFGKKHKRFDGFFEDCYLHPNAFKLDYQLLETIGINLSRPYFVLRFIAWNANHDLNKFGFTEAEKITLVEKLLPYGTVYISGEGDLPEEIRKYRINIPASAMHQVLHHASIYIGDSQTMATESALLGTPSIRYNSFVGPNDMTNFKVLENIFHLLHNFNQFSDVIEYIDNLLLDSTAKERWLKKREAYYQEVGDINQVIVSYIENA